MIVAALVATGCSGSSDSGTTPTAPTPPPAATPNPPPGSNPSCIPGVPANLQAATSGSTRVFSWNAVSTATDYFIQIGTETGRSDLVNTNTSQTTYSWTGASPGRYYARVYARNSCGSGANSAEIIVN
jgi:hypothetical protein